MKIESSVSPSSVPDDDVARSVGEARTLAVGYPGSALERPRSLSGEPPSSLRDEAGVPVKRIYLDVFQATQYEVGRLWQLNEVGVGEEHYCTAATQLIISQLYPQIFASEKGPNTLVATCVAGDLHELGARMVTDFFESLDRGKIAQVLNNLISNAVKFSHGGSRTRVRVTGANDVVTIVVEDEGQGIPAAEVPKLFQPFAKASVRSTAGEKSTGLGLAIVRKIVEGHGGRIWVESTCGKGSSFCFTLPVGPAPP